MGLSRVRAVFFDLDNTLIDTAGASRRGMLERAPLRPARSRPLDPTFTPGRSPCWDSERVRALRGCFPWPGCRLPPVPRRSGRGRTPVGAGGGSKAARPGAGSAQAGRRGCWEETW
ncbi:hypothetical protein P7K49_009145 [Saguinus oedipus]|uniref:Uncharacterized protein n=1 Tax=Saguinus oedipus TaxID=9490 RepID=A0ABQ9VJ61_SAGOE|nr:hypothetical protein P7K49_009145 [Saguinus oedipus]